MIINASGRCDIAAFYMPWMIERLQAGFVDVRNPFYPSQVSRVDLSSMDAIVFCTKNPLPLLDYQKELSPWPIMIQVTLTPYRKEIEPNVINKREVLKAVVQLAARYGDKAVQIRYDPIFLSKTYSLEYHKMMFERLCEQLNGSISVVIISFLDLMKNTRKHQQEMDLLDMDEVNMQEMGEALAKIAQRYHIKLKTCAEAVNLTAYGIENSPCFGIQQFYDLTGKIKKFKKGHLRKHCECIEMVDIGAYNCCSHFCRYCYANYDESRILKNKQQHDPHSTMIIGNIQAGDIIKKRK